MLSSLCFGLGLLGGVYFFLSVCSSLTWVSISELERVLPFRISWKPVFYRDFSATYRDGKYPFDFWDSSSPEWLFCLVSLPGEFNLDWSIIYFTFEYLYKFIYLNSIYSKSIVLVHYILTYSSWIFPLIFLFFLLLGLIHALCSC